MKHLAVTNWLFWLLRNLIGQFECDKPKGRPITGEHRCSNMSSFKEEQQKTPLASLGGQGDFERSIIVLVKLSGPM